MQLVERAVPSAKDVTVINPAPLPQKGWASFPVSNKTLKRGLGESRWGFLEGTKDPVYLGREVGKDSRMLHLYGDFGAHEVIRSNIVPGPTDRPWPFKYQSHQWLVDDPARSAPGVLVNANHPTDKDQDENNNPVPKAYDLQLTGLKIDVVHSDDVEVILELKARLQFPDGTPTPLMYRCYLYVMSHSPIVEFDWRVMMSTDALPDIEFEVNSIRMISGEHHSIDNAPRLGVAPSVYDRNTKTWSTICRDKTVFGDGVRFDLQGAIYGTPEDVHPADLVDPNGEYSERVMLMAARRDHRPVVGCDNHWDNSWLALRHVPETPSTIANAFDWATKEFIQFSKFSRLVGDYFDVRPRGLAKRPPQTGDQEAFGATKGSLVVGTCNPLGIFELLYSISEHLRPTAYYDHAMDLYYAAAHPDWNTWSQRTHAWPKNSDLHGKQEDPNNPGWVRGPHAYGWEGADDQHFGFINTQAAYQLTGRFWLRDLMHERIEPLLARWADGAGRAVGRVFQTAANDYLLLDDSAKSEELGRRLARDLADRKVIEWADRDHGTNIPAWQRAKDRRVLTDAAGNAVEAIVIWQHGLMALGLAAYLKSGIPHNRSQVEKALIYACRTVVESGAFFADGRWQFADAVAWNGGAGINENEYANGKVPGKVWTSGYFWEWNIGAVQILTKILQDSNPNDPLLSKCQQILIQSGRPTTWRSSEWRAVC